MTPLGKYIYKSMSLVFKLSKFVSVPILTEWLMKSDILVLDSALVNKECRAVYLKLMNEYFNLFIDSDTDMNLVEVCSWSLKFGVSKSCRLNNCLVRCRQYDWKKLECREGLMEAAKCVMANVNKLQCYHYIPILNSPDVCCLLSLTVIDWTDVFGEGLIIALLRNNPNLTSLDINKLTSSILNCIAVHCSHVKHINSEIYFTIDQHVLLMLSFHCRSNLSELPRRIPLDNDLVLKTLLWYRGAQLTQLTLNVSLAVRDYKLLNDFSDLLFCVAETNYNSYDETLDLIELCGSHINGIKLTDLTVKNQGINCLDFSKVVSLILDGNSTFNIKWFPCLRTLTLYDFPVTKDMFCSCDAHQQLQSVIISSSDVDAELLMCLLTVPNLTEVTLSHSNLLNTDNFEDLFEIVRNKLSKLTLSSISELTGDILLALVKRCNNLTELSMQRCYKVNSRQMLNIITYFRKLTTLEVIDSLFDDTVLDAFLATCFRCYLLVCGKNALTKHGLKLLKQHNSKFE